MRRPDDIPALLAKLRANDFVEVDYGRVTLHSSHEEIGVVEADAVKAIADDCHATQVVSVLYNTGLWARRNLFFLDNDGALKKTITLMSSFQTGNTLGELPNGDAEFQKIISGLARTLA
jgi:hypothetical protein